MTRQTFPWPVAVIPTRVCLIRFDRPPSSLSLRAEQTFSRYSPFPITDFLDRRRAHDASRDLFEKKVFSGIVISDRERGRVERNNIIIIIPSY